MRLLTSLVIPLLACVALSAADGIPPIPKEVWAIKADAIPGGKGAMVLEEWEGWTGYRIRFRVVSEAGKSEVHVPMADRFRDFKGRTTYPDGTFVDFNSAKDLTTQTLKVGYLKLEQQVMVPPGLTADCVVDIIVNDNQHQRWDWHIKPILRSIPSQKYTFEAGPYAGSYQFLPGRGIQPKVTDSGSYRSFEFRDLPADEEVPYALGGALDAPRFVFYQMPWMVTMSAGEPPEKYWRIVAEKYYKWIYNENLKVGRSYRKLSEQVRKDLPPDPQDAARLLMSRLEKVIQNRSFLTLAERAALQNVKDQKFNAWDLELIADQGYTSSVGFYYLFTRILLDAGIHPKLGFVCNRDQWIFQFNLRTPYQFADTLVGVESPGKPMVWLDPGNRLLPAGLVSLSYQGTPGMVIDTGSWEPTKFIFKGDGEQDNMVFREFIWDLGEEEDHLKASFSGTGMPEYFERNRFWEYDKDEQAKRLKDSFASSLKSFQFRKAEVLNALNHSERLYWVVEGAREAEEGRRRTIEPFPGMPYPLRVPDAWPAQRATAIVLPYAMNFTATSKVLLPRGWRLGTLESLDRKNTFGSVRWSTRDIQDGDRSGVEVEYTVNVTRAFAGAAAYEELKTFISWVEEASRRTLVAQKP